MESYIHLILTLRELPHGRHQKSVKISDFIFKCFFLFLFFVFIGCFYGKCQSEKCGRRTTGAYCKIYHFCFRQHAAYFCTLASCKCKRLNCEFGPEVISQMNSCTVGLARLKSMGKLVLPFAENFTAKKDLFKDDEHLFYILQKMEILSKN